MPLTKGKNTSEKILKAVIESGAKYGVGALSTKLLANKAKVSEGLLFHYYDTKEKLLTEAFRKVDCKFEKDLNPAFLTYASSELSPDDDHILWRQIFQWFLNNPTYTEYEINFRSSQYYTQEIIREQASLIPEFNEALQRLIVKEGTQEKFSSEILWVALVEGTLTFASHIIKGTIPNTQESYDEIENIVVTIAEMMMRR